MTIDLKPGLQAILESEVASGRFKSVDDALEAAVRALAEPNVDLTWARAYLDEAELDIQAGRTASHDEVWSRVEQRIARR